MPVGHKVSGIPSRSLHDQSCERAATCTQELGDRSSLRVSMTLHRPPELCI